jgi:hypothetical protein
MVILLIPAMRLIERSRRWKLAFAAALVISISPYPWARIASACGTGRTIRYSEAPPLEPYRIAYRFLTRSGGPPRRP